MEYLDTSDTMVKTIMVPDLRKLEFQWERQAGTRSSGTVLGEGKHRLCGQRPPCPWWVVKVGWWELGRLPRGRGP